MRNWFVLFICLALTLTSASVFAASGEADADFYLVPVNNRTEVDLIGLAGASVRNRTPEGVIIRTDAATRKRMESLGLSPIWLPRDPALPPLGSKETWHENDDVETILDNLAASYPSLTQRFTLGTSVQGRSLHGIIISDNAGTSENEVEIRIVGCHHGNEYMSVEISLLFAQYLLENYATDSSVRDLVDNLEFYIVPLVNPDGHLLGQRENANDIDLNRNYGYQYHGGNWSGDYDNSGLFSQPESRAVADHHFTRNFSLSLSYHTTAAYVNYFWNFSSRETPDEAMVAWLADRYADRSGYEATQGYDWYQTYGDTNDWSYGMRGSIDFTIETANSNISSTFAANLDAMLDFVAQSERGIHGVVQQAGGRNTPLHAMVLCDDPHWPVYTDPEIGDYHRLLMAGSYSCLVYSPGLQTATISANLATDSSLAIRNVELATGGGYYAFQVPATTTNADNPTYSPRILGPPDSSSFSISRGGMVIVDMLVEMTAHSGDELTVYEGAPNDGEDYRVYVSDDYTGPWSFVGSGSGTTSFDISSAAKSGLRYVKIVDLGDYVSTSRPGVDLDAVQYHPEVIIDGDEDGDIVDGDLIDGDDTDGDLIDGDDTDGDLIDGDDTDGDLIDGDIVDGDIVDGDLVDGDTIDGDIVDGDIVDGDLVDGDTIDGDIVDGDIADGDANVCGWPFVCFTLDIQRDSDCATQTILAHVPDDDDCDLVLPLCAICDLESFMLNLQADGADFKGPSDCTFTETETGVWEMSGDCGLGTGVTGTLQARDCRDVENDDPTCLYHCGGCGSDGDLPDGDTVDGDTTENDRSDGDELDGDTPDGDTPDGDRTDGDEPDGDLPDGDLPDGDAVDGDNAPVDGDTPGNGGGGCQQSNPTAGSLALLALFLLTAARRRSRRIA